MMLETAGICLLDRPPLAISSVTAANNQSTDNEDSRTCIDSVGALEDWLEVGVGVVSEDDDGTDDGRNSHKNGKEMEPAVLYAACPDLAWLASPRLRRSRQQEEDAQVLSSITGLLEETAENTPVRVTLWKPKSGIISQPQNVDTSTAKSCGSCSCPHRDWTRQALEYEPPQTSGPPINSAHYSAATAIIHWIDLSSASTDCIFTTQAHIVHMLRSLLGSGHEASPWSSIISADTERKSREPKACGLFDCGDESSVSCWTLWDCLLLQIAGKPPDILTQFRVSDACPSWCLYSTVRNCTDNRNTNILIYRRLPPRIRLSSRHPVTHEEVPTAGCLWETVVTHPEPPPNDSAKVLLPPPSPPMLSYRPTAPPYVLFESEYGDNLLVQLQKLLEPESQQILRHEVASIPRWTAWPEQQHYVHVQDGVAPWNVFPICHCFPANDPTKLSWIEATCTWIPRTVQLLQQYAGPALRTALFSRLDPNAVLEAHTGWCDLANHVMRVHIPIQIPPHQVCGVWVDGCVATHSSDSLVVFDDSKIHRAFNYHPTQDRIVLIVDLERPAVLPAGTATGGHSEELDAFIAQFGQPK